MVVVVVTVVCYSRLGRSPKLLHFGIIGAVYSTFLPDNSSSLFCHRQCLEGEEIMANVYNTLNNDIIMPRLLLHREWYFNY